MTIDSLQTIQNKHSVQKQQATITTNENEQSFI